MAVRSSSFSIRSGRGLGDNLYLQGVARYFVEKGFYPEVCTLWPDLFRPLAGKLIVSPFRKLKIDKTAHYIGRKKNSETDQFTDCCIACGIPEKVEIRLDWEMVNPGWAETIKGHTDLPVVLLQLPRAPMGRLDGYGDDLLPDCRTIQHCINMMRGQAFIVQVGAGTPLFRFHGIDLDLANQTTVCDLLDLASLSSGALGYCSFIVPLAESLNRPGLFVWSQQGLRSRNEFIRQIVPQKIFNRPSSRALMDNCTESELIAGVDTFLEQVRNCRAL